MLRHKIGSGSRLLVAEALRQRCFASSSSLARQESQALGAVTATSKGKEKAVEGGIEKSVKHKGRVMEMNAEHDVRKRTLYEHSRASSRPRPNLHTPMFASRRSGTRAKLLARQHLSSGEEHENAIGAPDAITEGPSSSSAFDDVLARTDLKLRSLYSTVSRKRADMDLVGILETCADIKERLEEIAVERELPSIPPPSLHVYRCLLHTAAERGHIELCKSTLEDMRALNFDVDVDLINFHLKACVVASDEVGVEDVLETIASMPSTEEDETTELQENLMPVIVSRQWTRNWTPKTYHHILLRCNLTHNLEMALALLGSASQTKLSGIQEEGEARREDAFLAQVLNPSTCLNILHVTAHCREARLLVDLALWMEGGASMRSFDTRIWLSVLRCCADNDWVSGLEIAWDQAVRKSLLTPDEGLVVQVLNTLCRVPGQSVFIQEILSLFFNYNPASSSLRSPRTLHKKWALQEWHLAPLFEAQCLEHAFEAAFRTANQIACLGGGVTSPTHHSLKALTRCASSSKEAMSKAYAALKKVGVEQTQFGGMLTGSLNAMIAAANRLSDKMLAVQIYRDRKYLRDARLRNPSKQTSPVNLPAPPLIEQEEKEDYQTWGGKRLKRSGLDQIMFKMSREELACAVKADANTFDELLSTAIDARDRLMGTLIFKDLNYLRERSSKTVVAQDTTSDSTVTPTVRTYERAIILCLTQKGYYEDAFKFLEEAKRRRLVPTRTSYEAIILRCKQAGDDRWETVARELKSTRQRPSFAIEQWLKEIDGEAAVKVGAAEGQDSVTKGLDDDEEKEGRSPHRNEFHGERKFEVENQEERRRRFQPKQNLYKNNGNRKGEEQRWE